MLLDTYAALKEYRPIDLGRALKMRDPPMAFRYFFYNGKGDPNLHYRIPTRKTQLAIRRWSRGRVTLNDWPEKPPEAEAYQKAIERARQLRVLSRKKELVEWRL
jgi:hypothetical protein